MKNDEIKYSFEVRPLSEDDGGGYLITFPDLPGCMSDGETVNEAVENGMDAAMCWLETAKERGQRIPEPKTRYSGQFVQRVPKSLHARLVSFAKHEGVSMNTLVAQFVAEGLANVEIETKLKNLFEESITVAKHRVVISEKKPHFYKMTDELWEKSLKNLEESLRIEEWDVLYRQEISKLIIDSFEKFKNELKLSPDQLTSFLSLRNRAVKKIPEKTNIEKK